MTTIQGGAMHANTMRQLARAMHRINRAKREREAKAADALKLRWHKVQKPSTLPRFKRRGVHTFRKLGGGALAGDMGTGDALRLGKLMRRRRRWRLNRHKVWAVRKADELARARARLVLPSYHMPKPTLFDVCQSMHGRAHMLNGQRVSYHR